MINPTDLNILLPVDGRLHCESYTLYNSVKKKNCTVFVGKNPVKVDVAEHTLGKQGIWSTRKWYINHPDCEGKLFTAEGVESFCTLVNWVGQTIGVMVDLDNPTGIVYGVFVNEHS